MNAAAILVDELSASASECFAEVFRVSAARVFGSRTMDRRCQRPRASSRTPTC
jgi:hypothetical protein